MMPINCVETDMDAVGCAAAQKKSDKHRLLMIAYFFPPIGGSGALRPLKLAKFLPDVGWEPLILTVKNSDWYYACDPDLLTELPQQVNITRSFMVRAAWLYRVFNPLRIRKIDQILRSFLIQPDDQIGWIPFAYRTAMKLLRQHNIDVIYSTSSPLSCHLVASLVHKRSRLPWIADFRDEWFENPDFNYPTRFHRRFHYRLENFIVNTADRVIAPAPMFCRLLAKHCKTTEKFSTVLMGFDPAEFSYPEPPGTQVKKNSKFVLAFAGLFYGTFRPNYLLMAISELIDEGKVNSGEVKVQFVGANRTTETGFNDRYGICEFTGFIPHKSAIKYLYEADVLLLLLSDERGDYVIPSKTFEYLASGKPILALIPPKGDVAEIIMKTGSGLIVDFKDKRGIKNAYFKLYRAWKGGKKIVNPDRKEIEKYNQVNITQKLANLLDELV
jgi:glycosyltransferase involved in cell wall biosynthesis